MFGWQTASTMSRPPGDRRHPGPPVHRWQTNQACRRPGRRAAEIDHAAGLQAASARGSAVGQDLRLYGAYEKRREGLSQCDACLVAMTYITATPDGRCSAWPGDFTVPTALCFEISLISNERLGTVPRHRRALFC